MEALLAEYWRFSGLAATEARNADAQGLGRRSPDEHRESGNKHDT
jgi:hypothetical protein